MSQSFKVQISGHDATVYASSYMQFGNKLPSKVFRFNLIKRINRYKIKAFDGDLNTNWHSCYYGTFKGKSCHPSDKNSLRIVLDKAISIYALLMYKDADGFERYDKVCVYFKVNKFT